MIAATQQPAGEGSYNDGFRDGQIAAALSATQQPVSEGVGWLDRYSFHQRNRDYKSSLAMLRAPISLPVAQPPVWRPMDTAPRHKVIIAMARYRTATAGFPAFVHFIDGEWRQPGRTLGEPMVCWAWKPCEVLGEWPSEAAHNPIGEEKPEGERP